MKKVNIVFAIILIEARHEPQKQVILCLVFCLMRGQEIIAYVLKQVGILHSIMVVKYSLVTFMEIQIDPSFWVLCLIKKKFLLLIILIKHKIVLSQEVEM